MRRSVQLPELADLGALPATYRGVWAFGRIRMGQAILHGPAADLGTVELEGLQAQGFGGREAVGARRGASQPFFEEVGDRLGPAGGMVATGGAWKPRIGFLACAGPEVIGGERIKAAECHAELCRRFGGCQGVLSEGRQHMSNERGRVAMG